MQDLGTLGGDYSWAYGVSADGSVVVGRAHNSAGYDRAFRWTVSEGMQDLGTLGGNWGWAYGISADGSVVVGWAGTADGRYSAFRWTASDGMQAIPVVTAFGVSADGQVVVGGADGALRWTAAEGVQSLGTRGGVAFGASADGSVIVGRAWFSPPTQPGAPGFRYAFRWTQVEGAVNLGTLGGRYSWAYGVSADGSVVVGSAQNAAGQWRAFRWTQARGMEDLSAVYSSLLTDGSYFVEARAISPDGRYIVGMGYNGTSRRAEAFLLDTER
jgi:probable HAF family extracellular repeat protein